jgi:hypothetical protein
LKKHLIIGITILDHEENFLEQKQLHGDIIRVNQNEGIVIILSSLNEEYKLPPDLDSIKEAPPGEYRFKSTDEVIVNPDFMTTWVIKKPKPKEI